MEDDESLVDGLCYTLEKQSYEIEVARSVAEAEKLLRESFDPVSYTHLTLPTIGG